MVSSHSYAQGERAGKAAAGVQGRRGRRLAALLATASLIALLADMPQAAAESCGAAAPPANAASPSMLYDRLREHTTAELLAIGFVQKPVDEACAWIYEVKVLTASGSVVELDFNATGLGLVGARGPQDDHDAEALVERFGGDESLLKQGTKKDGTGASASNKGHGNNEGSGSGGGAGGGGSAGGSGGSSGPGGGGGDGGEGGDSGGGEGGDGGDGGGEGGDGGGGGDNSGPDGGGDD